MIVITNIMATTITSIITVTNICRTPPIRRASRALTHINSFNNYHNCIWQVLLLTLFTDGELETWTCPKAHSLVKWQNRG